MTENRKSSFGDIKRELPDGLYEIEILDVIICDNKNQSGRHLKIAYDIVGDDEEFKGYFDYDYKTQKSENQKYKGYFYISLPYVGKKHATSKIMEKFREFVRALEDSNLSYTYNRRIEDMIGLHVCALIESQILGQVEEHTCKVRVVTHFYDLHLIEKLDENDVLPSLIDDEDSERTY